LLDVPQYILEQSANHCAWVALNCDTAISYGDVVIEIELSHAVIISSDGCGGVLVYSQYIQC